MSKTDCFRFPESREIAVRAADQLIRAFIAPELAEEKTYGAQ